MTTARFEARNHLGEIVLDSPPLNLFSGGLIRDLHNAVEQAAANDIRALLLRANGDVFSGGADVSVFAGVTESEAGALMTRVSADGQTTDSRRNMRSPGSNMPTGTALHEFYGGTEIGIVLPSSTMPSPSMAPAPARRCPAERTARHRSA